MVYGIWITVVPVLPMAVLVGLKASLKSANKFGSTLNNCVLAIADLLNAHLYGLELVAKMIVGLGS